MVASKEQLEPSLETDPDPDPDPDPTSVVPSSLMTHPMEPPADGRAERDTFMPPEALNVVDHGTVTFAVFWPSGVR